MISLENAKDILFNEIERLGLCSREVEKVPLWEVGGRVLAENVVARENVPAFDRSPIDGYALRASDTLGATADNLISFEIIDTVAAGSSSKKKLSPQKAMKIFTGAPLPRGADCVVKLEEAVEDGSELLIEKVAVKGEGVALKGEDILTGEFLLSSGTILKAVHMAILATLGIELVPVYEKPKIGVFSTGNELVEIHNKLQYGQLRVSNIYTLAEIVRQAGGIPVNLGVVKDRVEDVVKVYEKAYELKLPIVISTGGTASGDYDIIKDAMDLASATRLFNKVAVRPGAPVVASVKPGQLLIGLSGNPAGAAVTMLVIIFPIISKLIGINRELERSQGKLLKPIFYKGGLKKFLWANFYEEDGCLYVTPYENQFCGAIKTQARSNCLVEISGGEVKIEAGRLVDILKLP